METVGSFMVKNRSSFTPLGRTIDLKDHMDELIQMTKLYTSRFTTKEHDTILGHGCCGIAPKFNILKSFR